MDLKKGLVSIVVPVFNAECYVDRFVSCIKKQTYSKWELILVDDKSNDATIHLIRDYEAIDRRIKLKQREREPKGSVTCRNIGQVAAQGEYIIHFDVDDLVVDSCLAQRVSFMEKHPELDYATFRGESVILNDSYCPVKIGHKWGEEPKKDLLTCFLTVKYPFSTWNNIYRASVFKNIYWDENVLIYTDFSYIVPTILSGYKHAFDKDSKADYLYRVGQSTSAMTSNFVSEQKYESTKYLFNKTMEQLKQTDKYKFYKKKFKTYYILQYERLLTNGSIEQIEDYINFYSNYYSKEFRILLIYAILKKKIVSGRPDNFRRLARVFIYACYHPYDILKWIIQKK